MAQISYLWTTSSSGDGAATYTRSNWTEISKILGGCSGSQGVVPNYLNCFSAACELETLIIHSGGALVDGKPMRLTTTASVAIPAAVGGGNTRIDRVTLRAMWNAGDASPQTVRLWRIEGIDAGAPTVPDLVQTAGSTYDLPLWQATVNTAGTITAKTDERYYSSCGLSSGCVAGGIMIGASGELVVANDAVDDTKVGNRVLQLYRRQGGNTTDWDSAGTTDYTPTSVRAQLGQFTISIGSPEDKGSSAIAFQTAFSNPPLVFATVRSVSVGEMAMAYGYSTDGASCIIGASKSGTATAAITINWLAIGSE